MTDTTSTELAPAADTAPPARRVRIEYNLDTDRKTHALHHTHVYVDGRDISNDIIAIDWHADAKSIPTATITIYAPALDADTDEAEFVKHTPGGAPGPDEPLTQKDLGLHKLALANQGEQITALADQLATITQQLGLIFQAHAHCATCGAEGRQGLRPNINFINVIIDGTGYCYDHVDLVNGRLVPKNSSGIIVAGGQR